MLGTLPSDRRLLSNELDAEAGVSACMLGRTSSGEQTAQACANAFHEKAGRSQVGWWGFFVDMGLTLPSGLTDAILPSALLMSDSSLGASWAFSLQPVLPPDYRPLVPSKRRKWARR